MIKGDLSRIYPGPNIYSKRSGLVARLDIGSDGEADLVRERAFEITRAVHASQPIHTKEFELDLPSDLRIPSDQASAAEHIAYLTILLQRWSGYPVSNYAQLSDTRENQLVTASVFIEFCQVRVCVAALNTTINLLSARLRQPGKTDSLGNTEALKSFVAAYVAKPPDQTRYIREARKRDIPWRSIAGDDSYLEFGHGRSRQRVFKNFSLRTSHLATVLSTNKAYAINLLGSRGLPVPRQFLVDNETQALAAFNKLGAPVVLKPLKTDYGTGVHPGLMNENEVIDAFRSSRQYGNLLVETHIPGFQHRIMIINGKMTSARKHVPAHVIGNGVDTVRQLVEEANKGRARNGWMPIPMDDESQLLLKRQETGLDGVPGKDRVVYLRLQANLSTGGTMEVMTHSTHPENALMAQRAASILDIDIAGVDFITPDISRPYHENGGRICEVNVTPGFIFNEQTIVFDDWFKNSNGRIPVVVFLDFEADHDRKTYIEKILRDNFSADYCLVDQQGVFLNQIRIYTEPLNTNKKLTLALSEPRTSLVAVFLDSTEVVESGVSLDRIDLLIEPNEKLETSTSRAKAIVVLSPLAQHRAQFSETDLIHFLRDACLPTT